ncbi:MAG: hypothetical protein HY905_26930 [Deltaproteobacteria bacterium]|nr:hypothetical protein [Deltaproteobacteria bacterium]
MTSRLWTVVLAASLAALAAIGFAASCDGGDSGTPDGDVVGGDDGATDDGGGRDESNPTNGTRADFVINTMRIGSIDDGEGFNLDGVNTGPEGYLPPDGPGGVDNQLGALISALQDAGLDFDADAEIAASLEEGGLLILLRHDDVDDWTDDPGFVYLRGYAGKDADDPEDPTNNFSGDAELLVDERSLTDPSDIDSSLIYFDNGVLHDTTAADTNLQMGDFHAGPSLFTVDIPIQDTTLSLDVNGTQIVWDVDTAPTGDPAVNGSIKNGLLGGYVLLGDAARALSHIDLSGTTIDEDTIRTILAGQADMDVIPEGFVDDTCTEATATADCAPGQGCEADADRGGAFYCYEYDENPDAISLGIVFSAVSCRITDIWHDTPTP